MYEYPPILKGTEREQLRELRDYLVRMTRSLRQAQEAAGRMEQAEAHGSAAASAVPGQTASSAASELAELRGRAGQLRSLIIKTAERIDGVRMETERLDAALREDYLALSDFGSYTEQAELRMSATARQVLESYDFQEQIAALGQSLDGLDRYMTSIRGEIRRGLITDPESGEQVLGIAIAENLSFTGQVHEREGLHYYELSPGQTLGLYTAAGWQFWINGARIGWFDSGDGMLHVTRMRVVESICLSDSWRFSSAGGLGIQYIGG